jgi:hypothetical protein
MCAQDDDSIYGAGKQGKEASSLVSVKLREQLQSFITPLLQQLDEQIDRRLVSSFGATLQAILELRNRACGLLLSELGGYILTPDRAPAGTKRLSNLLRSPKWHYSLIEEFLWGKAQQRVEELESRGEEVLIVWDSSELEKPESTALEGLCSVRSSRAARLRRIKPGYYSPPGGLSGPPVFVPGMHWLGVLVVGLNEQSGPPVVGAMQWWTSRGKHASEKRWEEWYLLFGCARRWASRVLHVWDRGFAGSPWLKMAFMYWVHFVMRWPSRYVLVDEEGNKRKAWQIVAGKRSWSYRRLWDTHQRCSRRVGVLAQEVRHPHYPDKPLWLVVSRPGKGRRPWYLLTNEPVLCDEDAWRVVLSYKRRWEVETTWRYGKSELAMESPRLWLWDNRLKLLMMATLVYAFLLSLLDVDFGPLRCWLLRWWCHRNGKWSEDTPAPLYRLRSAISRLWSDHHPSALLQTSG